MSDITTTSGWALLSPVCDDAADAEEVLFKLTGDMPP
jgi:hypothetical protein